MKKEFYFMKNQLASKNNLAKRVFLSAAVLIMTLFAHAQQEKAYKICSHNYVINSDFTNGTDNSTTVDNWTFDPAPSDEANYEGWKQDNVLIYGKNLFVDKKGAQSAIPTLNGTPCPGKGKFVSFYYNSGNTGPFTFKVKLDGKTIATFSHNGAAANSTFQEGDGVEKYTIYRHFFPSGKRTKENFIWNNIWYEFNLYVTDYQGDEGLEFVYERNTGVSRQVRIDNVELRELIPTPEPKQQEVVLPCGETTYNLENLNPDDTRYSYAWYEDDTRTISVPDPKFASFGTYFLFAEGCESECVSYPSTVVKISQDRACCEQDMILNGGFEDGFDSWGVLNDNDGNNVRIVDGTNYRIGNATLARPWINKPAVDEHWIRMYTGGVKSIGLYQTLQKSCAYDPKKLVFDIVVDERSGNKQYLDVSIAGITLFRILPEHNGNHDWKFVDVKKGIKLHVVRLDDGTTYDNGLTNNDVLLQHNSDKKSYRYRVEVAITGDVAKTIPAGGNLTFMADHYNRYFLDNITLSNMHPDAESPIDKNPSTEELDGETSCPDGTFNLHEAEPDVTDTDPARPHAFVWYSDASGENLVQNPSSVTAGTYYMRTISTCSGCESEDLIAFEVKQPCPKVSGTLFSNYDGGDFTDNEGTNGGGMFAHLVDNNNKVLNVTEIAGDGTYSFFGKPGDYKVIINKDKVEPKTRTRGTSGVLSESTLNANYLPAGDDEGWPGDGISNVYTLTAYESLENIDFGVQSPPTASDITVSKPNEGDEVINPLYSTDDDPNWNNGMGQKFMITELSTDNGTLYYDGSPVELNKEYVYNPDLLIFKPSSQEQAKLDFKYIYKDLAGAVSSNDGVVDYTFVKNTTVIDEAIQAGLHIYADGVGNVVVQNAGDEALDIQFFDLSGRLVVQRTVRDNELARIPMQANGMYIVKAVGSRINHTERVIVR